MMKKVMKGFVVVLGLSFFAGLGTAYAVQCADATILRAAVKQTAPSAAASQYFVRITCPGKVADPGRGYYLASELGEGGYATILTAMSLGQTVLMNLESWDFGSIITEVQLNKAP